MKKSVLHNLGDFLQKLNNIKWDKVNDYMGDTLISEKGHWELSYSIKELDTHHQGNFPLQVVIRVMYDGELVRTWGCESNENNAAFLKFFKTKRQELHTKMDADRRATENVAEAMWNNL